MTDIKNLFQPKKDDKEIAQAERMLDLTAEKARICLSQSDFKIFRESYTRTESAMIEALISYSKNYIEGNGDLSRYALTMMRICTKIETVRYLLRTIESQAKRNTDKEANADG
jgi:hypothetical protein